MSLVFDIFSGSGEPIYAQIEAQIRRAVASGRLKEGDQLPSVRALAEQLTVNPNTVARAYNELLSDGLVEAQPGRGVFVAQRRQIFSQKELQRRLDDSIQRFLDETAFLGIPLSSILKRIEACYADYSSQQRLQTPKTSKKS